MSPTRPWVDAFADEMEAKLAANRKKGDRAGWRSCRPSWLLKQLAGEVGELAEAMLEGIEAEGIDRASPEWVVSECADIANFAMMIADVAAALRPTPASRKGPTGVTVSFACGGCDAKAEGTTFLRKRFMSLSGRDHGIGGPVWDVGVDDVVPEGWVAFDPYTYCTYCPKCWEEIMSKPGNPEPLTGGDVGVY